MQLVALEGQLGERILVPAEQLANVAHRAAGDDGGDLFQHVGTLCALERHPEAVQRDHGHVAAGDLQIATREHLAHVLGRDGELRLLDHVAQHVLRKRNLRQRRIEVGVLPGDVQPRGRRANVKDIPLVHRDGHVAGEPADNFIEQLARNDAAPPLGDLGVDPRDDRDALIRAGQHDGVLVGLHQHALQNGVRRLGRQRPRGDLQPLDQSFGRTGELHLHAPPIKHWLQ